jgi:hypothetical protein
MELYSKAHFFQIQYNNDLIYRGTYEKINIYVNVFSNSV